MNKLMPRLWLIFAMTLLGFLPAECQNSSAANELATISAPQIDVKLVDPHPNLPNQMLPQSINNVGEITGHLGDEHNGTGFVRSKSGQYTEFQFPGQCDSFVSPCTYPMGLNDRGEIVGTAFLQDGAQGFLRQEDGTITTLPAAPGNLAAQPRGINNRRDVVGSLSTVTAPVVHGFLLHRGHYTVIDFPGTAFTVCTGINSFGLITGYYTENTGETHGFVWFRGNFIATFQVTSSAEAKNTFPMAINDLGQVVGDFANPFITQGAFVRNFDGTIRILDLATLLQPIGGGSGFLTGINNRGDLLGSFGPGLGETFGNIFGFVIVRGAGTPW
ncbi:MAG TPA: hypothetical protein VFR08_09610 [Candidatus Angelobacter sp.]|nr:hypothetical protein [Candidatus Angelobacter sp.]